MSITLSKKVKEAMKAAGLGDKITKLEAEMRKPQPVKLRGRDIKLIETALTESRSVTVTISNKGFLKTWSVKSHADMVARAKNNKPWTHKKQTPPTWGKPSISEGKSEAVERELQA